MNTHLLPTRPACRTRDGFRATGVRRSGPLFLALAGALLAGCDSPLEPDLPVVPEPEIQPAMLIGTNGFQALPEVTFLTPLAQPLPSTVPFDATLTALLRVEVCAVFSGTCAGTPLAVISGADGQITMSAQTESYTAMWNTDASKLPAGGLIRIAVVLSEMTLATIDVGVTADGKQLRTALTDELLGSANRTLPIRFRVGRTPAIATHALAAEGRTAVEIAEVLDDEFGQTPEQTAGLLAGEGFTAVEVGGALKDVYTLPAPGTAGILEDVGYNAIDTGEALAQVFNLTAEAAAEILREIGYTAIEIGEALKTAFELQAQATAEVLKAIGYAAIDVAHAMEDAFNLQAQATAEILKAIGYAAIDVAHAMEDAFNLQAQATAEVLKAIGYAAIDVGHALEDVFNLTGEAAATILSGIGYAAIETATVLKEIFDMNGEAIVWAIKDLSYGLKEIRDALMVVFNIDEATATLLLCGIVGPACVGVFL